MIFKSTTKFKESDEYGYKKMFADCIDAYCCPDCRKSGTLGLSFLVWEDEKAGKAICPKCGFKRQFTVDS